MFSLVFLFKGSLPRAASQRRWSCAGLRLSMNFSVPPSLLPTPLSRGKRVQKYNLFPNRQAVFSSFFQKSFISLIVSGKNFRIFRSRTDFWGCLGENKGKIERFFGEVVGVNGRFFGKNVPLMTKNSRDSGPAKRIHLINI